VIGGPADAFCSDISIEVAGKGNGQTTNIAAWEVQTTIQKKAALEPSAAFFQAVDQKGSSLSFD
jgi:hypothetical protein